MKRRPRALREEEARLWEVYASGTNPLHPEKPAPAPRPPAIHPQVPGSPPPAINPPLMLDRPVPPKGAPALSFDLRPSVSERLAAKRVDMDRKKFGKMTRGKLVPEGRIDLHGMTQAEAHRALTGFLLMSHQVGRRLVLVITGKGGGPSLSGVLRNQVPHWLSLPPLNTVVLQLAEAHRSHGGQGALYVYLRRNRQD